jgi:mono/diheme cytochrome c family protein
MAGAANLGLTQMNGSQIKETILKGKGAMQSVALSEEQAVAVAKYVEEELKGK